MHTKEQLSGAIEKYIVQLPFPKAPEQLYEPIAYALEEGGKRIRPLLLLTVYDLFGGQIEHALPAAAAIEVFHNFTLLHDDVMDNAPLRRGKASVYRRWNLNTAILSGDAMMIYAYALLNQTPAPLQPRIFETFSAMALRVCEGQQYDMDFEGLESVTVDEYMRMIDDKTSALLAGAAAIGAILGGADLHTCRQLHRFATELGLAFQLQDDLLDSYGDSTSLGKQVGGDILEGKKTFLALKAMDLADVATRTHLAGLLRNREMLEQTRIAHVREIYDRLGVKQITEKTISAHFDLAVRALEESSLTPAQLEPLQELALGLLNRKK